jgi:hypothetical protein
VEKVLTPEAFKKHQTPLALPDILSGKRAVMIMDSIIPFLPIFRKMTVTIVMVDKLQ